MAYTWSRLYPLIVGIVHTHLNYHCCVIRRALVGPMIQPFIWPIMRHCSTASIMHKCSVGLLPGTTTVPGTRTFQVYIQELVGPLVWLVGPLEHSLLVGPKGLIWCHAIIGPTGLEAIIGLYYSRPNVLYPWSRSTRWYLVPGIYHTWPLQWSW